MTQQLNSNDTVDTSTFISGETEATILGRVKFYGQEMEYVTDGKLFLLTTHANWRTRKNAKSFRFLLDCNIQTGSYALDGTSPLVHEVSYEEHTTRGTLTFRAELGTMNIIVDPDNRHYVATFDFKGKSQKGSQLKIAGSFDSRIFID
ncbi:hypothetical protein ACYZT8_23985 [Pseudomonas sp. LB3P93]|jgi:hypothetical protein